MTLSLPRSALSIAELDDLDHEGAVRFLRALEEGGHRMVWIPEVAGREAFTTAALALGSTHRMIVGNGVARALERVPKSAASAARDLAAGYPGRYVLGLGVSGAVRERGVGPLPFLRDYLDEVDATIARRGGSRAAVPRVLGAYSAGITRLAAERADGLITFSSHPSTPAGRARRSGTTCSSRSSNGRWWAATVPRPAQWRANASPTT
ncbi:LLM class flavin-dependent oxidoreductase [Streptomyces malaysiensis subsp. malaysiensis]